MNFSFIPNPKVDVQIMTDKSTHLIVRRCFSSGERTVGIPKICGNRRLVLVKGYSYAGVSSRSGIFQTDKTPIYPSSLSSRVFFRRF